MPGMSNDETAIFDYLKRNARHYVAAEEIAVKAGEGKDFGSDRNWLLAILRRMEIEGWIESNSRSEYRLKPRPDDTTTFKKALETPGAPLGDTAIITFDDVSAEDREAV
jgi:hypothetical protein